MIWEPRLLPSDWLFRVVPLHLAQNKGSDKVWISYYWFMVRSVDHVMSTTLKFLDPRSHGPILTTKEAGRHSLLVYLGWGMGLEHKEPASTLLLETRYWGLAARWGGWHIIAHSPRLPRFRHVQFIWSTGILTQREGQILAMNLLLLVSGFSNRLGFLLVSPPAISYSQPLPPKHAFFQFWKQNSEYPCLLPPQIPKRPTNFILKRGFYFKAMTFVWNKCPIFRRDSLPRPSRKKPSQSAESLIEGKRQMSWMCILLDLVRSSRELNIWLWLYRNQSGCQICSQTFRFSFQRHSKIALP